jgi:HSP20 family molecular chaperone IbpA
MQINRRTTDDAYVIDIELRNLRPDEVQVQAQGRWLSIGRDTSAEEVRQEQFDDGRGYMRSFSYSTGSTSRRMGLPPDADPAGMQREERENGLTIRIPRKAFSGPEGGARY